MGVVGPKPIVLNASSLTGRENMQGREPGAFKPRLHLILIAVSIILTKGLYLINQAQLAILDLTDRESRDADGFSMSDSVQC